MRSLSEQGNISLYTLVLLPLVVAMTIAGTDLAGWSSFRERVQKEADRLAFLASNGLPNEEFVRSLVDGASSTLPQVVAREVEVLGASSVKVTLRAEYPSAFSPILSIFRGPGDSEIDGEPSGRTFSISRESIAQIVPTDYALVLVDGQSLRPQLLPGNIMEDPFLDNGVVWEPSLFFQACAQAPLPLVGADNNDTWEFWELWDDVDYQRWVTQSCFNPVFSRLKYSAISLIDSFAAYPVNRLSVLMTPGLDSDEVGFAHLRHIRREFELSDGRVLFPEQIGGFPEESAAGAQAHWLGENDSDIYLSDELCALLSNPDWDMTYPLSRQLDHFGFPEPSRDIEPLGYSPCGEPYDPFTNHLSTEYLERKLTLREAIYWHAAKRARPGEFTGNPQVIPAIQQAFRELVNEVGSTEYLSAEASRRDNLAYNTLRKIFVITDTLPPPTADVLQLVNDLHASNVELILVGFHHAKSDPNLSARLSSYRAFQNQLTQRESGRPTLRVFEADSPRSLLNNFVPKLVAIGREVSLKV